MTDAANRDAETARKQRKAVTSTIGGAVFGGVAASAMMMLIEAGWLGEPDLSQIIALFVALIYVLLGLIVGLGALSPAIGARFLNVEDADELREEKQALLTAGWGMVALGAMLAVLAISDPGGLLTVNQALGATLVLGTLGCVLSARSLRLADELMRATVTEGAGLSYYLMFGVLGGWATLAQLALVPPPGMLDILSMFWAVGLIASFWAAGRRGMLAPR